MAPDGNNFLTLPNHYVKFGLTICELIELARGEEDYGRGTGEYLRI